jgi:uncharacterized membrane protein YccC
MKEISRTWSSSIAFGWAFAWRAIVVSLPIGAVIELIPEASASLVAAKAIGQVVGMVLALFVAAHWLRVRGFGSVKVVLVEWADYQKAREEESENA